MLTRLTKTPLIETLRSSWKRWLAPALPPGQITDGAKLILETAVYVEARCPCGSEHIHRLDLFSTSECRRCNRTIAIRSIQYYRPGPHVMPDPQFSIGFVMTDEALARRRTAGVH